MVGVSVGGHGVPLVFLHGLGLSGRAYVRLLSRLAGMGFLVVALDAAGHGGTPKLPSRPHRVDLTVRTRMRSTSTVASGDYTLDAGGDPRNSRRRRAIVHGDDTASGRRVRERTRLGRARLTVRRTGLLARPLVDADQSATHRFARSPTAHWT